MRYLAKSTITVVAALTLLFTDAFSAVRHTVSRKDVSFLNPKGPKQVFGRGTAGKLGGVVLQSSAKFYDAKGAEINPTKIRLKHHDETDGLHFEYNDKLYKYKISEDLLARVFSWVENGGTGLYTAYSLTAEEQKEGGFVPTRYGNFIAAEFANSNLALVAEYLDFFDEDLVEAPENAAQLQAKHNQGLEPDNGDFSWVTSDIDSNFRVTLKDGIASVTGPVLVYYRSGSNDDERIYIRKIEQFKEGDAEKLYQIVTKGQKNLPDDRRKMFERQVQQHIDGIHLARSASLLRAMFESNKDNWERFADRFFTETEKE